MNDPAYAYTLDGSGPLYRQIKRAIASPILSGLFAPGTRLPSEESYTRIFDTSRMTVNRALQMLSDEGLISRHRRNGTFVAAQIKEHSVMELRDIGDEIAASGAEYSYQVLINKNIRADAAMAEKVGVKAGQPLKFVHVRHFADDRPHVIEERHINTKSVPEAGNADFAELPPSRWLLENVPWTRAEHAISALVPDKHLAKLLMIRPGEACLRVERTTWLSERPVTHVQLTYPGSAHRLIGRFTPGSRLDR